MTEEQRQAIERYTKARREYESKLRAQDNYDGNNPNKHVAGVRFARGVYETARYSLEQLGIDVEAIDREYQQG